MDLTEEQLQFVADTDPAFKALRADLRVTINETEQQMRLGIAEMLIKVIPCLMPGTGDSLQSLTVEVPAGFLKSMLPFFKDLSDRCDAEEALGVALAGPRNPHSN